MMRPIKNAAIEETTFTVRAIDRRMSAMDREFISLELVGEGGALDGLIAHATVFPGMMQTTQGRNVARVLDNELRLEP